MNTYMLYGVKIIENDETLKEFSKSVIKQIDLDSLDKDDVMDVIDKFLNEDLARTDISYSTLMFKYRSELGPLLYDIDNNCLHKKTISFFDIEAEESLFYIINSYIYLHFDDLIKNKVKEDSL